MPFFAFPLKEADGWAFAIPNESKEFTVLHSAGKIRRICLLVKNEKGNYAKVLMYKNKKSAELLAEIPLDIFVHDVIDEAYVGEEKRLVNRNMRLSKRPGRVSAGSNDSGRFVAARMMTPLFPSNPSISV